MEESVKKYYAFYCLPCDEFSRTELEEYAAKTWLWAPKPKIRQGEEVLPPELPAGIGLESGVISYGGLYTLLTRLDFDVKGTAEHFTVIGADGHSYEFSYGFWEEKEMDWADNRTITLPVWYHLRDGYPVGTEEETIIMELKIIPKQENIPSFDSNAAAVKHIEYYPSGGTYDGDKITPELIQKILKEVPKSIGIYLSLDPDGECDWLEVVSDGEWLFLGYCFQDETGRFDNWYSYNPDFADTMEQIQDADFSDRNIYTPIDSGGQSPIPKIQAITDMDAGVKAVEYFIRTGKRYPGIDWMC